MLCSETIDLSDVPSSVWASSKLDVGFVNCTPYKAKLKPDVTPIYLKQYPLSEAKAEGVRPMIQSFLEQGILKPLVSPYNTPINPVPKGTRQLSPKRIEIIHRIPKLTTRKELPTFLGMINYCRQRIPEFSHYDSILREAVRSDSHENVFWSPDMLAAYNALKVAIVQALALGLPVYCKPFHLYARDNCKTMAAVCAQEHGGGMRPIAFFSKVVPAPVQGMPACLRAVAAWDYSRTIGPVNSGPMSVLHAILTSASDSVSIPSEPHNCIEQIHIATSPRADLSSTAFSGPSMTTVFVDDSCSRPNDDAILLPSEVAVIQSTHSG
ncbi:Hypothetical predicted protein [Pelobates cultripes]|uniref:Reverse transcriptase/retrotransposon-derived protein RNase H-like domain-containing protein n=1 Tax=Pelobates cultripes TaxID=61616 RepID=A0AAD1R0T8_PELCU|nr:Hypothetical predicted protein [Pelobates cultripes]